jgi:hypothetical protein
MTQAQRTQTSANSLVPAAVAGLVMVAALTGAILVNGFPTLSLTPAGTTTANAALVKAQDRWAEERLAQSLSTTSVAAVKSARQWEAMQDLLTTHPAAKSSTFTEAQRQAVLRHQLIDPDAVSSQLSAAIKLQIEREYIDRQSRSATERVATPTDPKIR